MKRGFTLIEVLVALAAGSLLVMIALSSYRGFVDELVMQNKKLVKSLQAEQLTYRLKRDLRGYMGGINARPRSFRFQALVHKNKKVLPVSIRYRIEQGGSIIKRYTKPAHPDSQWSSGVTIHNGDGLKFRYYTDRWSKQTVKRPAAIKFAGANPVIVYVP